ncbi:MAG: methionine--tRNA ligase subunit beta [Phycisphaerae bacterium]
MTDIPQQPPQAPSPGQTPPAAPAPAAEAPAGKPTIPYDDFAKLDLRVGRVLEAKAHPNADRLICMTVDMGTEKRQIIAGIKAWYAPEELVGKLVVVVANLAPRKMRGLESNGMVLAATGAEPTADNPGSVVILTTDREAPPGSRVS